MAGQQCFEAAVETHGHDHAEPKDDGQTPRWRPQGQSVSAVCVAHDVPHSKVSDRLASSMLNWIPDALATAFVGLIEGLQLQWLYDRDAVDMDTILKTFLESVIPQYAELRGTPADGAVRN